MEKQAFMHACREGGRAIELALTGLYRDYGRGLSNEAWRVLRDAEAARDLLQDVLIKAWSHCSSFRGESELYPWLTQIVRRRAIDVLRSRRDEQPLEDDQGQWRGEVETAWTELREGLSTAPQDYLQAGQSEQVFRRCAERFTLDHPEAAAVVSWIAEDGLTPAEISPLIGRNPGATRQYISQCRKKARHYFAEWYLLVGSGQPLEESA